MAAALELLEEHGPDSVTTRKVSQRIGVSSQVLYSDFGSIGALVQAMVEEGFAALDATLGAVKTTDDPVHDIVALALAYRRFALERPRLYAAMYAMTQPGGYRRTGEELRAGTDAFMHHVHAAQRAITAGRLEADDAVRIGLAMWTAVHGWVAMELAGYAGVFPGSVLDNFAFAVQHVLEGFGETAERCRTAVESAMMSAPAHDDGDHR